ncbi:MAG: TorF family putative porin [Methylophaga sp.]
MKKLLMTMAMAGSALGATTALHAEEVSPHSLTANVGMFSQYVFRGITYSDERMALQGGFDYAHASGWYAGVWGSSLEEDDNAGNSLEVDFYGGYYHEFTDDFAVDVGLLQFYYPDHKKYNGENIDTTEAYVAATWKWFTAKYSRTLTDWGGVNNKSAGIDGYANGDTKGTGYYELNFNYGLPMDINLTMHVGRLDVENYSEFDYTDYMVGLSKDFSVNGSEGWTVGVNYTDTNADKDWWAGVDGDNRGDNQFIAYISRTF